MTGNTILETERFRLRVFCDADADVLFALYTDPDVMRYLGGTRNHDTAKEHVAKFADQFDKTGYSLWAVEHKASGQFVGRVGLWPLDKTDEVELGYVIARRYWGQGAATETSLACLEYGFGRLELPFIAAIARAENGASLRVMQKLGFRFVRNDRFYDTDVLYHRLDAGGFDGRKQ